MKTKKCTPPLTGLNVSALALILASTPLLAADEDAATESNLETVVVVGQAASLNEAIREQRQSDNIQNVVHADGIAQLPDQNAAEAVQRLPGISVERDQGEGRFVSVRGLAPDLNAVTINGTLLPAPESDRRAVALDVIPAELVQSLSVVKSPTPDMDANSLGGTIEVEGLSGFDHEGLFYTVTSEGSVDDNSGESSPKFSGAVSDRFSVGGGEDNLAVAAAFNWQRRNFASDDVETGGAWDFEDGARLEELEDRDYDITRERSGLGLNFDFRPDDYSNYYLRTLYSRFEDDETRNASIIEFEEPLRPGETGSAEVARELKDREETQEVQSYVLGGERMMGLWTLSGQVGYSRASEETPDALSGAVYAGHDSYDDVSFSNTRDPRLHIDSDFQDASSYALDEVEREDAKTTDTEKNVRLDLARENSIGGFWGEVKFGGKLSRRDKDNDQETWIYEGLGDYYSADQLSQANVGGAGAIDSLLVDLDRDLFYDEEESRINDFDIQEDIDAAYLMQSVDVEDWRFIAGVRYEGTHLESEGTGLRDGEFESVEASQRYDHWLPGLHARYQLTDETQLRAAWTNTVVRPTFGQMAPGYAIDGDEASFGNPDLEALESSNFDVGIEHYMGRSGVVSAFTFYKDIDNFIYQTDLAGTGEWTDFYEAATFANGDSAKVYGLELAYSQKLDWLPGIWGGLIVSANATFSRSDATITGSDVDSGQTLSRDVDLPNQSDRVANLTLGWENERLSLRASANYKSDYLAEVGAIGDADHDLYTDDQLFLDLGARYFLTPYLRLSFDVANVTDEAYYVYTGSHDYNAQYEQYGPTYKLGLTLTNF
ncbi:TonB-dependent receptor [Salinicola halophilus]|uniref:TonB-dependent receptor n=1 Tax=Salinicola halophilus TaxID=184065 RepID=UPI000DA2581F|nr:TonB-dependent receptor [Salinicola halophilus]